MLIHNSYNSNWFILHIHKPVAKATEMYDIVLRSQVVYSKQPKLGLTQEFVVLLVRMRLVVYMFVCLL